MVNMVLIFALLAGIMLLIAFAVAISGYLQAAPWVSRALYIAASIATGAVFYRATPAVLAADWSAFFDFGLSAFVGWTLLELALLATTQTRREISQLHSQR